MPNLRVISYNIRYATQADGRNAWSHRRQAVADLLAHQQPDLIGLQEVTHSQLTDLIAALPGYGWIGVGRDDGATAGEYVPIFYRHDRLTLHASGHFWLSATPAVAGSFGWDADCVRVTTWAHLTDKLTSSALLHLNTHFDHRGMTAQIESAHLLHIFLAQHAVSIPAIITGDFNCTPDSATYQTLLAVPTMTDAMNASRSPHEGPTATFTTDFAEPLQEKIDYIFLHTPAGVSPLTVHRHAIVADQVDGYYPSDHLPVLVDVA